MTHLTSDNVKFFYHIKHVASMLPSVCTVIDYSGSQNMLRTSLTHSATLHVSVCCSYHILMSSVIYY